MRDVLYILFGYLSGSLLFAKLTGALIAQKDITAETPDGNPGTANAFRNGGMLCGILTLCGDLFKGFFPVYLYLREAPTPALVFVLAAPVIGHVFPIFFHFSGGKGIATTFGCLLGLLPDYLPVACLAFFFILYSTILRLSTHYHRTLLTYPCAGLALLFLEPDMTVTLGFLLILGVVYWRLLTSPEEKKKCEVQRLWMR